MVHQRRSSGRERSKGQDGAREKILAGASQQENEQKGRQIVVVAVLKK
jgi:hypothetical protein